LTAFAVRPNIRFPKRIGLHPAPVLPEVPLFDGLKARLDRLFREHTPANPRAYAEGLREALLEAKLSLKAMREGLAATEAELEAERKHLTDAERRGRLAGNLPDPETVSVAERFVARHRERIVVLERKLAVQRDELVLAEREAAEMMTQYRSASGGNPSASIDAAWRDLESAGASRPTSEEERFAAEADQRRRERAVEEQLAYLKRKLGKNK
jgi:hypothetical protein